jgi:hypothetical protein
MADRACNPCSVSLLSFRTFGPVDSGGKLGNGEAGGARRCNPVLAHRPCAVASRSPPGASDGRQPRRPALGQRRGVRRTRRFGTLAVARTEGARLRSGWRPVQADVGESRAIRRLPPRRPHEPAGQGDTRNRNPHRELGARRPQDRHCGPLRWWHYSAPLCYAHLHVQGRAVGRGLPGVAEGSPPRGGRSPGAWSPPRKSSP